MKKSRILIALLALSLILTLASCEFFDLLKDQRAEAVTTIEAIVKEERFASLSEDDISDVLNTALEAINAAKSEDEITQALNNARDSLDKLLLDAAKADAKAELRAYVNLELYSDANKALIESKISEAEAKIDACKKGTDITPILDEAKAEISKIVPALDEAKSGAKSTLDSYATSTEYTEANWALIEGKILEAKTAIDACESVEAVATALENAKAAIDAVPTILGQARADAISELESYITDKTLYSENGIAQIDRIISDAKENINSVSDESVITAIVEDTKADLDKVLTLNEEFEAAAKAFKESLVVSVNDGDILNDKLYADGASVIADVAEGNSTRVYFGSQDGNTATVFDAYLTIDYRSTEWSVVTLYFRAWDDSTAYIADIRDGRTEFVKGFWNNDLGGKDRTTIIKSNTGIENGKEVHLQVISWGWTKMILIDGECVFKTVEDDYNAGRIYIETWQAGWTLRNPVYKEYASDAELEADYADELAKTCVNKSEAELLAEAKTAGKSAIASHLTDVETTYSTANQAAISGIISAGNTAIDSCTSIDAVNAAVEQVKKNLDGVLTIAEENELATAKTNAKAEIAGYLKDVETNYTTARQTEISGIISEGNTAIDACASKAELEAAVTRIKAALNAVPTLKDESDTALISKKDAAKEEIAGYLKDVETKYSTANQTTISGIIANGKITIAGCTSAEDVDSAVAAIKAELDAVLTIEGEKIAAKNAELEAFKATLSNVDKDLISKMTVKDGKLVVDSKQAGLGGTFKFGTQTGNMNKAIDFYMTVHYNTTQWSSVSVSFCAWDANTTLKMEITNDSIKIYRCTWGDNGPQKELLVEHSTGVANDSEVHIQIITRGWTKAVLIDGVCILKYWPNEFHEGYTMFSTWEAGFELRDVIYNVYGSEDEVTADYGAELAKDSIHPVEGY